jgi:hypothetical protein
MFSEIHPLPLPLHLGHFRHQEPNLIAVEFRNRCDAVDVLDEVFRYAEVGLERRLSVEATENGAVWRLDHVIRKITMPASQDRFSSQSTWHACTLARELSAVAIVNRLYAGILQICAV